MIAKSINGTIEITGDLVVLRHKTALGLERARVTLKIVDVEAVDWIAPQMFAPGFLRLRKADMPSADLRKDDNAIGFAVENVEAFKILYNELYRQVYKQSPPDDDKPSSSVTVGVLISAAALILYIIYVWVPVLGWIAS